MRDKWAYYDPQAGQHPHLPEQCRTVADSYERKAEESSCSPGLAYSQEEEGQHVIENAKLFFLNWAIRQLKGWRAAWSYSPSQEVNIRRTEETVPFNIRDCIISLFKKQQQQKKTVIDSLILFYFSSFLQTTSFFYSRVPQTHDLIVYFCTLPSVL